MMGGRPLALLVGVACGLGIVFGLTCYGALVGGYTPTEAWQWAALLTVLVGGPASWWAWGRRSRVGRGSHTDPRSPTGSP